MITVTLTMYDSTNVGTLPHGADAYAGYVQGLFPTFAALQRMFTASGTHLLSIAVFASGNADCLDIESGDATNAQAPGWVKRQLARSAQRPCLYTSVSNMDALMTTLGGAGISRAEIRLWSAHYGQGKHICAPGTCGLTRQTCDGTQWTDAALGRSLDESVLLTNFFSLSAPATQLIVEESMLLKTGAGALTHPGGHSPWRHACPPARAGHGHRGGSLPQSRHHDPGPVVGRGVTAGDGTPGCLRRPGAAGGRGHGRRLAGLRIAVDREGPGGCRGLPLRPACRVAQIR